MAPSKLLFTVTLLFARTLRRPWRAVAASALTGTDAGSEHCVIVPQPDH
jgi:hypothetical protein